MVRFTLKQCTYVLAVAEHGGFAPAARALAISQPALAQAVDKIEAMVGLTLFIRRHARGVTPTSQGEAFLKLARRLVDCADGVEREAASIAADLSGAIRLGCFHTIAPFHAAMLAKRYRSLYPRVGVTVTEGLQDELVADLVAGRLDLAVLYDMALDRSRLALRVVAEAAPYIILPADHALAARPAVGLAELATEPYVMFAGAGSRDYFRALLAGAGIDPPIAFESASFESVRSAVANGLGFSLLAMRPRVDRTYDGQRLAVCALADSVAPIPIVLAQRRGETPSSLVENFTTFCAAHFADTA